MKLKNTIFLALAAFALFAFIWFYEQYTQNTFQQRDEIGRVVKVDRDQIDSISIKNPENRIELQKTNNQWFITEPVKDRADSIVMSELFTTLEGLRHAAVADENAKEKEQLKPFGLSDPNTKIRLNGKNGKQIEIQIGLEAAVKGKVYAKVDGSNVVHVLTDELKNQISRKVADFRDRKLSNMTVQQITGLSVQTPEGGIELAKKDNHWVIVKPMQARADDQKVNDLISKAAAAHISKFATDGTPAAAGLVEPRGSIIFTAEGESAPLILEVGAASADPKEEDQTYVKLSSRDSATLVPTENIEKLLKVTPNDVRDKSFVRFEQDIVDRITIEAEGHPKLLISRKGEAWVRKEEGKDTVINSAVPKAFLNELQGVEVDAFLADTAIDLPKYELDKPKLVVTLSSFASENTSESNKGEKPIVSISFGSSAEGETHAKLDTEPFIVDVRSSYVDLIPVDPVLWQSLFIYKYKPNEITSLEITREGEAPLKLESEKGKKWKATDSAVSLNQVNVQSVLNTLCTLRAIRWIGQPEASYKLHEPSIKVSFTTDSGGGSISIGAQNNEEMWYSSAEGLGGVFLLSRPDHDIFSLPLTNKSATIEAAAPAPSSAPAATPQPVPAVPPAVQIEPATAEPAR